MYSNFGLPEDFTAADRIRLQRLQQGLSGVREDMGKGEILPELGFGLERSIMEQLAPLLKRREGSKQQALAEQKRMLLDQSATMQAVEELNMGMRADNLPARVVPYTDSLTGRTAHLFEKSPNQWEQLTFEETGEPAQAGEQIDYRPLAMQTVPGQAQEAQAPEPQAPEPQGGAFTFPSAPQQEQVAAELLQATAAPVMLSEAEQWELYERANRMVARVRLPRGGSRRERIMARRQAIVRRQARVNSLFDHWSTLITRQRQHTADQTARQKEYGQRQLLQLALRESERERRKKPEEWMTLDNIDRVYSRMLTEVKNDPNPNPDKTRSGLPWKQEAPGIQKREARWRAGSELFLAYRVPKEAIDKHFGTKWYDRPTDEEELKKEQKKEQAVRGEVQSRLVPQEPAKPVSRTPQEQEKASADEKAAIWLWENKSGRKYVPGNDPPLNQLLREFRIFESGAR